MIMLKFFAFTCSICFVVLGGAQIPEKYPGDFLCLLLTLLLLSRFADDVYFDHFRTTLALNCKQRCKSVLKSDDICSGSFCDFYNHALDQHRSEVQLSVVDSLSNTSLVYDTLLLRKGSTRTIRKPPCRFVVTWFYLLIYWLIFGLLAVLSWHFCFPFVLMSCCVLQKVYVMVSTRYMHFETQLIINLKRNLTMSTSLQQSSSTTSGTGLKKRRSCKRALFTMNYSLICFVRHRWFLGPVIIVL